MTVTLLETELSRVHVHRVNWKAVLHGQYELGLCYSISEWAIFTSMSLASDEGNATNDSTALLP